MRAAVGLGARLAEGLLVLHAGDEGGEAGLDLLPHQLGLVVGVEVAELQHHRREPRHAAHLPGPQPLEEVQHAVGRHPMRDQRRRGRRRGASDRASRRAAGRGASNSMPCRMKPPSASSPVFQLSRWSASSTCSCSGTGSPSSARRSRSRTSTSPLSTRLAHDQRLQAGEVGEPVGVGGRGERRARAGPPALADLGIAARARGISPVPTMLLTSACTALPA